MTLENIVYACYEEHKKHTSNWQHGKPQKAYYDLEGLKIFYEDGKITFTKQINSLDQVQETINSLFKKYE